MSYTLLSLILDPALVAALVVAGKIEFLQRNTDLSSAQWGPANTAGLELNGLQILVQSELGSVQLLQVFPIFAPHVSARSAQVLTVHVHPPPLICRCNT